LYSAACARPFFFRKPPKDGGREKGHEHSGTNRIKHFWTRQCCAGLGYDGSARAKPGSAPASSATPASTAKPGTPVDVAAILDKLAASNKEKLDWRHSIVDLMKLLGLDSSLAARKTLADELHFSGDKNDSASMNIWLHKQVMTKLAENGGKVPDDLRK
jgi:Domain of unknown function (DUF3597)